MVRAFRLACFLDKLGEQPVQDRGSPSPLNLTDILRLMPVVGLYRPYGIIASPQSGCQSVGGLVFIPVDMHFLNAHGIQLIPVHHLTESVNFAVSTLGHGQAIGVDGHHSDAVFSFGVGLEGPIEGNLPLLELLLISVFGDGSCNSSLSQEFWHVLHLLLIFSEGDFFVGLGS